MDINNVNSEKLLSTSVKDYNSTGSSDKSVCSMCIDDFDNRKDYYECTVCKNKMHRDCLIKYVNYHEIKGNIMECYICNRGMFNFSDIYPIIPTENPEYSITINESKRSNTESDTESNSESDDSNRDVNYFLNRRFHISFKSYLNACGTLFAFILSIFLLVIISKSLS